MKLAIVGPGKMGANMARRLCRGGVALVGYNRSLSMVRNALGGHAITHAGQATTGTQGGKHA